MVTETPKALDLVSSKNKTQEAYAVLRADGSLITWGAAYTDAGDSSIVAEDINGDIPVVKVYATQAAFAALRDDGSVITWGNPSLVGDSKDLKDELNGSISVVHISSSYDGFAAIREDGTPVLWGDLHSF